MIKVGFACVKFEKAFWGFVPDQHFRRQEQLSKLGQKYNFTVHERVAFFETAEDAAREANNLNKNSDFAILDVSTFPEGKAVFAFVDNLEIPFALWSRSETVRNSNIAHNSFCGANYISGCLALKGIKCRKFFGEADSSEFRGKISTAIRLTEAAKQASKSKIGLFGGIVPKFFDIDISDGDRENLEKRWDIEFKDIELKCLIEKAKSYKSSSLSGDIHNFSSYFSKIKVDLEATEKITRLLKAVKEMVNEEGFSSIALRCWPELQSDFGIYPCAAISALNETGVPTACEGDAGGALDMLIASKLSKNPSTLVDIIDWNDAKNTFSIWHCGPTAVSWAGGGEAELILHNVDGKDRHGKAAFGLPAVIDMEFSEGPVSIFRTRGAIDDEFAVEGNIISTKGNKICGCFGELADAEWYRQKVGNSFLRSQIFDRELPHHYTAVRKHIFSNK